MREGLFKNIITKNLKWFICIGVLFLVTSGISIATSTILMKIIDEVLPLRNFDKLMEVICIYVLLSLLQEIFSYTCSYANMVFTNKTEIKYKQTIIDKILNKQGDFFVKNNSGNLFQTINGDIAQVCSFIVGNIFLLMYTVFSLLTSAIYLFVLNPILLLIIFLLQPFSVILQKVVAPKIAKYSNECRDIVGKYILAMQDIFVRPIDIVLSGLKNSLVDRVNKKLYEQYHMRKRMFLVDSLCSQMSEFLRTLTMCAVIGYGGYCIINGSMSVGVLVIFITYSQRLMSHIERLLNFTLDFSEIKPIYGRNPCRQRRRWW